MVDSCKLCQPSCILDTMRKLFSLFIIVLFPSLEAKPFKHHISMAMIFQNEAEWLKEWIEYHHLIGVEHFYLYNHMSTDHYKKVLAPYVKQGIVTLTEWSKPYTTIKEWTAVQSGAYCDAIKRTKGKSHWLAVLDSDEFLVPVKDKNLKEFLKRYPGFGGVVAHWQMFGTSFVEEIPANKLMIEKLVLKAQPTSGVNKFVKSIFRPHLVVGMKDPHVAQYKKGFFQVNTLKQGVGNSSNGRIDINLLRVNHYWSRDEKYFKERKCARRQRWREGIQGQLSRLKKLNDVEDKTIFRFVPALRKRMGL